MDTVEVRREERKWLTQAQEEVTRMGAKLQVENLRETCPAQCFKPSYLMPKFCEGEAANPWIVKVGTHIATYTNFIYCESKFKNSCRK